MISSDRRRPGVEQKAATTVRLKHDDSGLRQKARILHLISSSGLYGAENVLLSVVRELRSSECSAEVGLIGKQKLYEPLLTSLGHAGIPVRHLVSNSRWDFSLPGRIRHHVLDGGFQIVHTHGYKADIYGYYASRRLGISLIATAHGWTHGSTALRMYATLDHHVLRRFDRVVAVSEVIENDLMARGVAARLLTTVRNGVHWERFRDALPSKLSLPSDTEQVVGMVGRLVPEKGFQTMIEAAPQILARKPRTTFLIAGEGPYRSALEELASNLGISSRLCFAGYQEDMPGFYKVMDVMALPSFSEGTPICILEAMSAGVPVVATAVGGIGAIIADGQNGCLVRPGSTADLANAVLALLLDQESARTVAQRGTLCVREHFSSSSMAVRYADIYRQLLPGANC